MKVSLMFVETMTGDANLLSLFLSSRTFRKCNPLVDIRNLRNWRKGDEDYKESGGRRVIDVLWY